MQCHPKRLKWAGKEQGGNVKAVNKNAIAVDSDSMVIIIALIALIALAFFLWGATANFLNKNSETVADNTAPVVIPETVKFLEATKTGIIDVSSNPSLAGIELFESSIKNIGANMALIQIEGISELLAPGQAMAINSATRAIYVAHPKEEYIWPDGHGGYLFDFYNKRPKVFPLY